MPEGLPLYVTADNGTNVQLALRIMADRWNGVGCFSHTMQLIVLSVIK